MPVVSVGCNNGDAPTVRHSQVTSLDKFHGPPNIQVAGQPVEGRSGGGLFSSEGYVIGVCNAADPSDKEGLFAALASIYAELDRKDAGGNDLSFVYKSPSGSLEVARAAAPAAEVRGVKISIRFESGADAPAPIAAARAGGLGRDSPNSRLESEQGLAARRIKTSNEEEFRAVPAE